MLIRVARSNILADTNLDRQEYGLAGARRVVQSHNPNLDRQEYCLSEAFLAVQMINDCLLAAGFSRAFPQEERFPI